MTTAFTRNMTSRSSNFIASRVLGTLLSLTLLASAAPARAEEAGEPVPWYKANFSDYPGAKKAVSGTLLAVSSVSAILSFVWVGRFYSAQGHLKDFPQKSSGVADCSTAGECADLQTAVNDVDKRQNELVALGLVTMGTTVGAVLVHFVWPNESRSPRVVPGATNNGGSLTVVGSF